ncbi:MAG TPA: chloride channel protein [Candidatus Obscuribacterales bacterium]
MQLHSLAKWFRPLLGDTKQIAIVEACVIGLVSGLAAVTLKHGAGWLGGWRIQIAHQYPAWIVLPLVGLIGGGLAGLLVQRVSPEAAGSGIPQVKAALSQVPIALNLRVAIVKMFSVILILGSGFSLGRQGPTVQIGAALASQLSHWIPTSPEYRRQLLAAGAAAGLAAGFNAPIAGVLFVVEELLQDFSGLTLGTAILASFVGAVVSRVLGGQGLGIGPMSALEINFSLIDVPFFILLGALAGLLGTLFSHGIFLSLAINRRFRGLGLPWKVAIAGLLSGAIVVLLPPEFRDNTGLRDFLIGTGQGWRLPLLAFSVKFLLTLVAYGSGAPGGIFAPALLLGSSLGYLVGLFSHTVEGAVGGAIAPGLELTSATTYALAGMGAFFSAITRGPITAIVIVFEMVSDFNLVLPLMIGSVSAYLVSERLVSGSLYNRLLTMQGINLDKLENQDTSLANLSAETFMQRRVETLSSEMPLPEVIQAFSRSHHRGFPVVDQGKLVGIVTQSDLADASRRNGSTGHLRLVDIMTPQPVTVSSHDSLVHVLYLLNRFKLSRLPVTDRQRLVGIITRADIIRAESDQLSGELSSFGPQPEPSYVVYQTRSPSTGQGRLLVPLSNPQTGPLLLKLAIVLARDRNYELDCLQVITVPRGTPPSEATVRTTASRRLLRQAESLGRSWGIPVHTQIRVAHDAAHAMLETVKDHHIDLILMGWKGNTSTPGRVFGNVVDTVIRQAACEVLLVRLSETPSFNRWLLPVAGGPNAQAALKLLPPLLSLGQAPLVRVCQIFPTAKGATDVSALQSAVEQLRRYLSYPVIPRAIVNDAIADSIVTLAQEEHCDVIVLGASRESLLKQVIQGNIPEAIARHSSCTVILVRDMLEADEVE